MIASKRNEFMKFLFTDPEIKTYKSFWQDNSNMSFRTIEFNSFVYIILLQNHLKCNKLHETWLTFVQKVIYFTLRNYIRLLKINIFICIVFETDDHAKEKQTCQRMLGYLTQNIDWGLKS